MVITNKFNLPQALVKACSTSKHNEPNTLSATTLLGGVKSILLNERHWEELEEDVSDRIWAIQGTAVHKMLQDLDSENFQEERFSWKVSKTTVTGQVDLYDMKNETVFDYKNVNLWKIKMQDYSDFRRQGLIYAWLMKKNGLEVKKCRFIMLIKNWTPMEYKKDPSVVPQCAVSEYSFDVTEKDLKEIEQFVTEKVLAYEQLISVNDDLVPECSEKERWYRPGHFKVMQKGRKTSTKNFYTKDFESVEKAKEQAEKFAESVGGVVVEEYGTNGKCENYCSVCQFCNFYKLNVEKLAEVA